MKQRHFKRINFLGTGWSGTGWSIAVIFGDYKFCAIGFSLLILGLCSCTGHSTTSVSKTEKESHQAELDAAELDHDKQKVIWEDEHITFELEWRFGPHFKESLKNQYAERLANSFRSGFTAHFALEEKGQRTESSSGVRQTKFEPAETLVDLNSEQFIESLLKLTARLSEVQSIGMRVLHINQIPDRNKAWETRLLITIDGMAEDQRIRDSSEHTVQWTIESDESLESDPVIDRWIVEKRSILEVAKQQLFREVTSDAGLHKAKILDNWNCFSSETQQYRFGVAVEDFNRDGFLDIAVAVYEGKTQLFEGSKDLTFREVSEKLGVAQDHLDNYLATWVDVNNDGFPDLILGNQVFQNNAGQSFTNITKESGLQIYQECMGATVADYDCDGQLDLYFLYQRDWEKQSQVTDEKWVDESQTGRENELWKNNKGRFTNVTETANAGAGKKHTHSAAWFFYDNDPYPDLYIANDFGKNSLLRNTGRGTFEDISEASGTSGFSTSMGVATGDLNNDGINEVYVANMYSKMGRRIIGHVKASDYPAGIYEQILGSCAGNQLYVRGDCDSPYVECGDERGISHVGWAFAPAFTDFNNDGLLDIYSTTGFMSFQRGKPDG